MYTCSDQCIIYVLYCVSNKCLLSFNPLISGCGLFVNIFQEPVKVPGATPRLRPDGRGYVADGPRPTSDGIMFSAYPERRVEFEVNTNKVFSCFI